MKFLMTLVVTAMTVLSFQNPGAAQIRIGSPKIASIPPTPLPLELNSTNRYLGSSNRPSGKLFQPLNPRGRLLPKIPEANPDTNDQSAPVASGPLPSGEYQTKPYDMIVIVPGRGIDDRILAGTADPNSQVPVLNPHIEAIPMSPPKP